MAAVAVAVTLAETMVAVAMAVTLAETITVEVEVITPETRDPSIETMEDTETEEAIGPEIIKAMATPLGIDGS